MNFLIRITVFIIFIISVLACSKVPISGRRQLNMLPESQLMSMSLVQYKKFLNENTPVNAGNASTQQVQRVGNRIALAVEKYMNDNGHKNRIKGYEWEFNLINQSLINAWAMPGGKVVVYQGLLPVAMTDEGLAVVMGHEIAHAIARHGNERMSQGMVAAGIGVGLAVAINDKPKETQALFLTSYGAATGLGILAYGRNQESEADKLGMVFMAIAGYNPVEAIAFWERMKNATGSAGSPPEFLSTHPSHDTRIDRIKDWLPVANTYFGQAN
jgi:predicted Zn-dependent protease